MSDLSEQQRELVLERTADLDPTFLTHQQAFAYGIALGYWLNVPIFPEMPEEERQAVVDDLSLEVGELLAERDGGA